MTDFVFYPLGFWWGLTSTAWFVLWGVLATLTVVLVVLLRTRWASARPLRKCAILSLWVHVLLACVTMAVRIVAGPPGAGEDLPIRVAILPVEMIESEPVTQEEEPPEWLHSDNPPLVAPDLEPLEPPAPEPSAPEPMQEKTPPPEAPPLLESPPEAVAESAPVEQPPAEQPEPTTAPTPAEAPPPHPEPTTPRETTPPAPAPPLPEKYADRFAENRQRLVIQRGGSPQTEKAVQAALGWLASAQSKDGRWNAAQWGAGEERVVLGHNRHKAGAQADTGITGLALLAFLGTGQTHQGGPYAQNVAHGLEFLRQRQRADGSLQGDAQLFAQMYCHSMATFSAAEAYALTRDPRLQPLVESAVGYSLAAQHPTDGGWRYHPRATGDTSQLGWQLMALKSADLAGVEVPDATWTRVDRFLRRVRRGSAGGLAAYRPEGPASRTMTAEALFCRGLLEESGYAGPSMAASCEAAESITRNLPSTEKRNLYFWYYATIALHQSQHHSSETAEAWKRWNHALTRTLLATQQEDGSWSSNTVWGGYGGRVYTTALSAMCLEVYYRYGPEPAAGELAGRGGWHAVRK